MSFSFVCYHSKLYIYIYIYIFLPSFLRAFFSKWWSSIESNNKYVCPSNSTCYSQILFAIIFIHRAGVGISIREFNLKYVCIQLLYYINISNNGILFITKIMLYFFPNKVFTSSLSAFPNPWVRSTSAFINVSILCFLNCIVTTSTFFADFISMCQTLAKCLEWLFPYLSLQL